MGDHLRARASFTEALEQDICPLRILPSMSHCKCRGFCKATGTDFIDVQFIFSAARRHIAARTGILVDHIHPSIRGHQLIANKITETLEHSVLPSPIDDAWQPKRVAAYKRHLDGLDELYYARGRQASRESAALDGGKG